MAVALLACGAMTAQAQKSGEFRFGVEGGMNVSKITNMNSDWRLGFSVGLRGEYNFTNNLYMNAGLLWSQKGSKYETSTSALGYTITGTTKSNPGYIQIPIDFGYRFNVGDGVSIFGQTGPYFAFGCAGKWKYEVTNNFDSNLNQSKKTDFFGDNGAQVFDGGWGVRIGVEASGFQVHMGYEYGFSTLGETAEGQDGVHNSNFNIGVSYMF